MSNEDFVFGGIVGETKEYDLKGASLSYLPIQKERFSEVLRDHKVSLDQGQIIWDFYRRKAGEAYDKARLQPDFGSKKITKQTLEQLQFDRTAYDQFVAENGIDSSLADDLFLAYEDEVTATFEKALELQEQADQPKEEVTDDSETYTTPQEARAFLEQIRNNPQHPYNDEKATPEQHEKAVEAVNALIAIEQGKATNFDHLTDVHNEISERYHPKREDRSSSNKVNPSLSLEQPDTQQDGIGMSGEGKSSASGGRIEDVE